VRMLRVSQEKFLLGRIYNDEREGRGGGRGVGVTLHWRITIILLGGRGNLSDLKENVHFQFQLRVRGRGWLN